MSRIRLTETKIKALKEPGVYRDDMVHGLFVDVSDTSARYKLQSTTKDRRTLRRTLGRTSDYTLEQARRWAQDVLGANRRGEAVLAGENHMPTLQEALDAYLAIRDRKGQDDVWSANIKHQFNKHLSDWLGLKVDRITPGMVEARHAKIAGDDGDFKPVAANHTIKSLRAVLNKVRVLKGKNPVEGIEWFVPPKKVDEHGLPVQRAVMPDQLAAWWREVDALENPLRRCFHRLMLLSGIRSGHLKEARRAWINLDARYIHFPQLKAGRPFKLPLSTPMVALVTEAMGYGDARSPWLFPAESGAGHLVEPRDKALLKKGVKVGHDLRRTYVSLAAKTPIPQHHREFLVDHTVKGMHGLYVDPDAMFPELLSAQEQISALILNAAGVKFAEN